MTGVQRLLQKGTHKGRSNPFNTQTTTANLLYIGYDAGIDYYFPPKGGKFEAIVQVNKESALKIYIRNMVCIRCKMVVKSELQNLGLHYSSIDLGEAEIMEEVTAEQLQLLGDALKKTGLELMDDKKSILVEKIKAVIIELVHYTDEQIKTNLSEHLSEKLGYNYTYLANLFSEVKGTTIENFYLNHKIEKVKELLVYDELNLTEIADKLHYSSVAHLSNQFKKMTGLTPSHFKNLKHKRQITLGNV